MSLPETIEHQCHTCSKKIPGCGHKRRGPILCGLGDEKMSFNECPECNGKGYIIEKNTAKPWLRYKKTVCEKCKGSGIIRRAHSILFPIILKEESISVQGEQ